MCDEFLSENCCLAQVFGLEGGVFLSRGEFLKLPDLPAELYAEYASSGEFRTWLYRTELDPSQANRLAMTLMEWTGQSPLPKLKCLMGKYPEACNCREVREALLRRYVQNATLRCPHKELLAVWKKLCGPARDISVIPKMGIRFGKSDRTDVKWLLDRLGEGGQLTADGESEWLTFLNGKELAYVLRHVKFTRCATRGISNLAVQVVNKGSVRLLKEAERAEALAWESREELLAYAATREPEPLFRAALLSMVPGEPVRGGNGNPVRGAFWSSDWDLLAVEERVQRLRQLWEEAVDEETCLVFLEILSCRTESWPTFFPLSDPLALAEEQPAWDI